MKLTDAIEAGLVATAVTGSIGAATALLPDLAAVHAAHAGTPSAAPVRHGQIGAVVVAVAVSGAIGFATGSIKAAVATAAVVAALLAFYEWLLRKET